LLNKRQFVVTHTILQTEIPALVSWIEHDDSVKILCPQINGLSLYFYKNIICLRVGLLRIGQVFSVSRKIVYWWVTTSCRFMSDIFQPLFYDPSIANNEQVCTAQLPAAVDSPVWLTLTVVSVEYIQTSGCL
jgi:hypothetical protein